LETEAQQLRERLASLEEENRQLQVTIEENNQATATANERAQELLDMLDETCDSWTGLDPDKMEAWTVQTEESLKPTLRS